MLDKQTLAGNETLKGLTDDQINAICEMSANDENAVISAKLSEVYSTFDAITKSASGVEREGAEKTYNYVERVAKNQREQIDILSKSVNEKDEKIKSLEMAVAKGADGETKKMLEQAQIDLKSTQTQFADLQKQYNELSAKHENELFGMRVDNEINGAMSNIRLLQSLPQNTVDVLKQSAFAKIKASHPTLIDDGKGGKIIAFADENGATLRNPATNLQPYTTAELLNKIFADMEILETKKQGGAGGSPNNVDGGGSPLDLTGVKTQSEAREKIKNYLLANGYVNGSSEFDSKMLEIRTANNVSKLPLC